MASSPSPDDVASPAAEPSSVRRRPSAAAPASRRVRRYAFACTSCKARKVKCSGEQPVCHGCQRSGEECTWPSQTSAESRLRSANARIRDLEASIQNSSGTQSLTEYPLAGPATQLASGASPATTTDGVSPSSNALSNPASESLWFQVGVGEDGAIVYNGPTSRFHAGSVKEADAVDEHEPRPSDLDALKSQYTLMNSIWMPLITGQPFIRKTGVPTEIGLVMLDIYWTWLHPLHNCVYKPALIMDLALGGPYCSDFLLMCIFALVARHLPEQNSSIQLVSRGEGYIAKAKELLLVEMSAAKPAIPTIQGLLILGGRQGASGNSSEGWLYTGMALRMMTDIGLHLDTSRLAKLERWTPAEMETRKRLYNAAFIWDKTLSLALGRPPSLTRKPYGSDEILDKFDDEPLWRPVHATEVLESFVPIPALNSSTFCAFCSIHEITTDMMLLFSNSPNDGQFGTNVGDLDARFEMWYNELPQTLKIMDPARMSQSPPPHIISLNLLYHTLRILLRRPYLVSPDPRQRDHHMAYCISHSKQIYAIHDLFTRTFPHRLMTYQVSYCIFIAASAEVQELKNAATESRRGEAATRLAAAVRVLQDEASHTPGIGRTLDTIRRLLCSNQSQEVGRAEMANAYDGTRNTENHGESDVVQGGNRQSGTAVEGQPFPQSVQGGVPPMTPQLSHLGNITTMGEYSPLFLSANAYGGGVDIGSGWTNTGAGFHPDAMSWAVAESLQRSPAPSTFNDQSWTIPNVFSRSTTGRLP